MINTVLSAEDVVDVLELSAADVAVELDLTLPQSGAGAEAVSAFSDSLIAGGDVQVPEKLAPAIPGQEQVMFVQEMRKWIDDLKDEFRHWRVSVFEKATDRLKALAEKAIDLADSLGVSVEHLLARMQRRITRMLIEGAVLTRLTIEGQPGATVISPTQVVCTTSVRTSPSFAVPDMVGVMAMISGILALEIDVAVTYGVVAP